MPGPRLPISSPTPNASWTLMRPTSLRSSPPGFWLRKFRRPEDRIGDVHEGPRRQHSHVEGQLHANFHDFRSGEAETQCPFDHPTDGHVVLSPYYQGRQGADDPALHIQPGPCPDGPPEVLVHQNVQRAFHRRWLRRMVAEHVGDQLPVFRDSPLVQVLGLERGIEGFGQGNVHTSLFKDLLGHRQGIIGSRYATVEGDHHEYLDDLLRRETHIQSIAYVRSDLRGELDGGDRQGRERTLPELQTRTPPHRAEQQTLEVED